MSAPAMRAAYWSQTGGWADAVAGEGGRRKAKLFRPLPHDRCDCYRCMEVRDENQGAREMMNWRQPAYRGTNLRELAA